MSQTWAIVKVLEVRHPEQKGAANPKHFMMKQSISTIDMLKILWSEQYLPLPLRKPHQIYQPFLLPQHLILLKVPEKNVIHAFCIDNIRTFKGPYSLHHDSFSYSIFHYQPIHSLSAGLYGTKINKILDSKHHNDLPLPHPTKVKTGILSPTINTYYTRLQHDSGD